MHKPTRRSEVMDPDICLVMMQQCLSAGDFKGAREYVDSLRQWVQAGGFEPDWTRFPVAAAFFAAVTK